MMKTKIKEKEMEEEESDLKEDIKTIQVMKTIIKIFLMIL
jgi:hypothetical protein